jgi:Flp pilus assembly protein TadD
VRKTIPIALVVLAAGCAEIPVIDPVYPPLDTDQTLQRLIYDSEFGAAAEIDVLSVSPELAAYIRSVRTQRDAHRNLQRVANLFRKKGDLAMQYDVNATLSAADAFAYRRGNCLTYTHLFIAMVRAIGMRVRYQEVLGVQQWDAIDNFVVLNRHIAAYGNFDQSGTFAVDFGQIVPSSRRFGRIVSDDRARAQHFNNLGAEALTGGESEGGIAYFNRSILIDPGLTYVWTNLGTTYSRLKRYQEAEWAFTEALRIAPYDVSAINQMASLYSRMGRQDLAAAYRKRSERERDRNPYYLFREGVTAIGDGDFERAVDQLRQAAKRQPDEMHFYLQLGKAYALAADARSAKRAFVRAEELMVTDADRLALSRMINEVCAGALECVANSTEDTPEPQMVDTRGWPWG